MKLFSINCIANKIYDLFAGSNSSSLPKSQETRVERVFQAAMSYIPQAIKTHPTYTLGGCFLFTCMAAFIWRSLTKQIYPATVQESFKLLQDEVLEGKDIQRRVNDDPNLLPLKRFIHHFVQIEASTKNGNTTIKREKQIIRHQVLHVLFGIKPALAFGLNELDPQDIDFIKKVSKLNPNCILKQDSEYCYFCNESPFLIFDPRTYIVSDEFRHYGDNILKATMECFPYNHQNQSYYDQFLSYLLGFGPSWEEFQRQNNRLFLPLDSIFTDEHYWQLGIANRQPGIAINHLTDTEYVRAGKEYSQALLDSNQQIDSRNKSYPAIMDRFCMCYAVGKIGTKTPYFQCALYSRWKIALAFEKLFNQLGAKDATLLFSLRTLFSLKNSARFQKVFQTIGSKRCYPLKLG